MASVNDIRYNGYTPTTVKYKIGGNWVDIHKVIYTNGNITAFWLETTPATLSNSYASTSSLRIRVTNSDTLPVNVQIKRSGQSYIDKGTVQPGAYVEETWTGLSQNTNYTFYTIVTAEQNKKPIEQSITAKTMYDGGGGPLPE